MRMLDEVLILPVPVRARSPRYGDERCVDLSTPAAAECSATLPRCVTSKSKACENGAGSGIEVPLEEAPGNEVHQEALKIRRLQIMVSMVMSVISQDPNLTIEEASELVAGTKRAALAMFPDKELAYDILYKPRLQRLMNERFHLQ
jgi:hypothetical protein